MAKKENLGKTTSFAQGGLGYCCNLSVGIVIDV